LCVLGRGSTTTVPSKDCERVGLRVSGIIVERQTHSDVTSVAVEVEIGADLTLEVEVLDLIREAVPWSLN